MTKMIAVFLFLFFASPTFGQSLTIETSLPTIQEVENLIKEEYASIEGKYSKEEIIVNVGVQKFRATITAKNKINVDVYWVFRSYHSGTLLDCPDGSKPDGADRVCHYVISIVLGGIPQKNIQKKKEDH